MIDGTGTSTYTYDPFGELTSYESGAGKTVSYTYDDDGKTTGITYPLGSGATWATTDTVGYAYDNADELTSVTDFNNNTITVGNTADGLPNSEALGSTGDTIATTYDPADRPSQITLASSSSTLLQFGYSDVPSGAIASETDSPSWSGSPAGYTYDSRSRVTQMTPGSGSAVNYGFDASGNLTTLPSRASGSYDNASELTSTTLSGSTTTYAYDADGERNRASVGGSTTVSASYDGGQRLTAYSDGAANMSAASYDGDGLRQSTTLTPSGGSPVTEAFTWDVRRSVPHLLMDSDRAYVYLGAETVEQVDLSNGHAEYLLSDALGSVRGVIESTGALSASTAYDAWGTPETSGGISSETPFGFGDGYTDGTGLVYAIHRYYDPVTGQFITVDPLVDRTATPYLYASDDPVNALDPSGLCSQGGESSGSTNPPLPSGGGRSVGILEVIATGHESGITAWAFAITAGKIEPYFGTFHFTLFNVDGVQIDRSPPFTVPTYGSNPEFEFEGLEPGYYKVVGSMQQGEKIWPSAEDDAEVPEPEKEPNPKPRPNPQEPTPPGVICSPSGCRIGLF